MPFFVNLFFSSIVLILILKAKMMTTAIIFMAVVFFLFKYTIKTRFFFIFFLTIMFFNTLNVHHIPPNLEVGILGTIIDKTNNFYVVKSENYYDVSWKKAKEKLYFSYNKYTTDPFEIGNKVYIIGKKDNGKFEIEHMSNSHKKSIYSLRNFFKERIYKNFPYQNKEILFSVIFGGLRGKTAEIFKNSGLLHLFAVSGFHVYIIYLALYFLYSKTTLYINYRRILTVLFLFFYLAATGFSDSATRATFLLSAMEINKIFGFNIDSKNLLGIIGVTNLLYNPTVIFSAGFLMSYFAALSILLIIEYNKNPFIISLAAFLAILPWNILFFKGFSLLSPVMSIVFVPIVYSLIIISFIFLIIPLPQFITGIIDYYISIIKNILQYINNYILYINLNENIKIIFYIISILLLIIFHYVMYKKYRIKEEF
ncbi:ComEC/Rec2 family competence protein [Marinitoga aeolica]|uniref:ComEC/Rec2 family competence protein n=1 Tax=Marinitoga aeolica TaxID=2809031 RepID=A0ABY8PQP9_9BACT|nr:ComEC/Rec2 family competence protein [Marinitoga aeolica]WGS64969.1 ComEC/Rec2 family competence protein [Marinitoga aeolica]